jgi:hypothetical protein
MPEERLRKVRNLTNSKDEISLNDIFDALIDASHDIHQLELKDNTSAAMRALHKMREARNVFDLYYKRLKEVKQICDGPRK